MFPRSMGATLTPISFSLRWAWNLERSPRHHALSRTMTLASELLHQHIQSLVADDAPWQTLIADDLVWDLPYAPAMGHPVRLSGRKEVVRHVTWCLGAVKQFRFFGLQVYALADPDAAVAEVQAEARIKTTARLYRQASVLFLRAAQALDTPILGLGS
jgi:hypothetical protein